MSFICFLIILFFSISNKFIFCKFGSDNHSISSSLLESVEKARTNLKVIQELIYFSQEFQELYKLTRDEILKFGDIIKTIPNHDSYTHNNSIFIINMGLSNNLHDLKYPNGQYDDKIFGIVMNYFLKKSNNKYIQI
ncbi:uncharacterized protein TA11905 [Theileria annulata]|uniref:Uncharacterized protein n=1 Tax=Theileria annulata TaxID=5874 RepID=Q4UDR2_THEAN|nr:uncharacterized protein TA11905 [Theileria annulata]CAI74777.1 hypothetical protein TA11905 [Theileria annulata]|eukprot:XP_952509.1 hypothetical protein TA11905 [Theileria annulata]